MLGTPACVDLRTLEEADGPGMTAQKRQGYDDTVVAVPVTDSL